MLQNSFFRLFKRLEKCFGTFTGEGEFVTYYINTDAKCRKIDASKSGKLKSDMGSRYLGSCLNF